MSSDHFQLKHIEIDIFASYPQHGIKFFFKLFHIGRKMNEGLPQPDKFRDALCAPLDFSPASSSTPQLIRSDRQVSNCSPALPFRTGHYLASSASSSCSSSSSEHPSHSLSLNLSSLRNNELATRKPPPHSALPSSLCDFDTSHSVFQNIRLPLFNPQDTKASQATEAPGRFSLDKNWNTPHPSTLNSNPVLDLGGGALSTSQFFPGFERAHRSTNGQAFDWIIPATAPLEGTFSSSGPLTVSPATVTNNLPHYGHRPPHSATFPTNEPPSFPSSQSSCQALYSGPRAMSISGNSSGLRGSRAPPPPALNAHAGWQHRSVTGADLSPVSASYYPYSPFPPAFSQPLLTASPYTAPRSSDLFDLSPLSLHFPSQLILQDPVQEDVPRSSGVSHSQVSPPTPLSAPPPLSSSTSCLSTAPDVPYASLSLEPPRSSSPSSLLHALYTPSTEFSTQSNTIDYSDVTSLLSSFSSANGWPPSPQGCRQASDPYTYPSSSGSDPLLAQPFGFTKKGKPRMPRQRISCDFCRVRKLRVSILLPDLRSLFLTCRKIIC